MSRWDILLDRTNQAKIKTDYVNEVNKENEKNIYLTNNGSYAMQYVCGYVFCGGK